MLDEKTIRRKYDEALLDYGRFVYCKEAAYLSGAFYGTVRALGEVLGIDPDIITSDAKEAIEERKMASGH